MMLERLVTGCLVALAVFWIGASRFVLGDGVPDWWLPVSLGVGLGATQAMQPPRRERAPRWLLYPMLLAIAVAFAATAFGAVATPSRHWDGAASFDAKVFWLCDDPTLQQPFFADPAVFHHSPDYPLLQALLVAMADRLAPGLGRAMMPLLYLLLCGVVAAALHRRGVRPLLRGGVTLAVALTPALLTSGGGAVDSGYSELALLLATTTIAGGLLNGSSAWFGLGIGLAIASKPEGAFYAVAALAVAVARGDRALLRAALFAFLLAGATWLPVRAALLHTEVSPWALPGFAAFCAALLLLVRGTASLARPQRVRWTILLALPVAALVALPWLAPSFSPESALGVYLRQANGVLAGLANLPAYLGACFEYGISRMRLGMSFVLPLAAALVAALQRRRLDAPALAAFVGLGLAITALPFVLSPEHDLDHHLRSSLPRLLLHWVGPAWLLSAAWLERLLEPGDATLRG